MTDLILDVIITIFEVDLYDHVITKKEKKIHFTLTMMIFIRGPKIKGEKCALARFGFANHFTLIACLISCKQWV